MPTTKQIQKASWKILGSSAVAVPHTGDTSEFVLATVTIPAGMLGTNGCLRITTNWSAGANNANAKTCRIRFGGTSGTSFLAINIANTLTLFDQRYIQNRGAANSQVGMYASQTTATANAAPTTASIDTTVAVDVVIAVTLANSSDTVTLESYCVEIYGP